MVALILPLYDKNFHQNFLIISLMCGVIKMLYVILISFILLIFLIYDEVYYYIKNLIYRYIDERWYFMESLSKPYWKKVIIATITFVLINYIYFFEIIHMHVSFANILFLILIDILIFLTLLSDYLL